ncbi:hypothetical protein RND71_023097 [Anisodus tanguticus]|uniref:Uncharacterized protein n=1 Tax=Anisodus tanguticus TaxID=243964 RepID=A0AAE1V6N5_9SOLA|nr:hypothetical protein RND71_023097 [Anisodus tanguticus]
MALLTCSLSLFEEAEATSALWSITTMYFHDLASLRWEDAELPPLSLNLLGRKKSLLQCPLFQIESYCGCDFVESYKLEALIPLFF